MFGDRHLLCLCLFLELKIISHVLSFQEFATAGSSNTDTGKVHGSLETKYKWSDYGVTFTEKWNTDNTLGTEMAIEDQVREYWLIEKFRRKAFIALN